MKNNEENDSNKTNNNDDDIEKHDFDGIKEKDTPIPLWFNLILYGSIVFAFIYFIHYQFLSDGHSLHDEEAASMGRVLNKNQANSAQTNFDFESASKDPKILGDAKAVYETNCASCHGMHGEGGVGPNLVAGYWTHGDTYKDIVRVISEGVMSKGMPAWGPILGPNKVNKLVAYIVSIQGSNPPNAKKPEGTPGKLH